MFILILNGEITMSFAQTVLPSNTFYPAFNLGLLMDYSTGKPKTGLKGETIINGGLHHLTGITGMQNSLKTGNLIRMMITVLDRYYGSDAVTYDTERTLQEDRIHTVAEQSAPRLLYTPEEILADDRLTDSSIRNHTFTDVTIYPNGDQFYDAFKTYGRTRPRNKGDLVETPFVDGNGKIIRILPPSMAAIDSYSMFSTESVGNIQDKASIGESGRNIEALRDNMAKNQMMLELPKLAAANGLYFIMTAHLGKQHQMDPMTPPSKQLSYLKQDLKLKNVPEKFSFLVHNLWFLFSMKPLLASDKTPQFPRDSEDAKRTGDSDLQVITCMNLRGKSGVSGYPIDILASQTEGILESLTEFNHFKKNKFGTSGNDRNYQLDIYPEVNLTRTTIRRKLEEDSKLRVASRITADLVQIKQLWHFLPEDLWCDAKTLYEDLKAQGHDWDKLLQTRGHWTFDQYTNPVPFLSTMDLLYMRKGLYTPYWY